MKKEPPFLGNQLALMLNSLDKEQGERSEGSNHYGSLHQQTKTRYKNEENYIRQITALHKWKHIFPWRASQLAFTFPIQKINYMVFPSPLKVCGSFQSKCEMIIFWLKTRHYCQFQTKNVLPEQAFLAVVPETMGNMLKITNEIHSCTNCETPVNAEIV